MNDEAHQLGKGRWKVPAGSLVVDIGMVVALIWTVSGMQKAVEHLDRRMIVLESREISPGAERRIAVLESAMARQDRDREQILSLLNRIDDKLDDHLVQTNGKYRRDD